MQNIDKLAIGAAILFIIGGLAFPYMVEPAADLSELRELTATCVANAEKQKLGDLEEASVLNEVRDVFGVEESVALAEWTTYRRPARVKTWSPVVHQPPVHEPGRVTRVESRRDDDLRLPVLDIEVAIGKIERASLTGAEVQVQADDGDWVTKATVSGRPGDLKKVTLTDLEHGRNYSARLVTRVKPDRDGVNGGFQREQMSEPSAEAVWLPVDENWEGKSFQQMKVGGNGVTPDKVTIQRDYWDYDKGKFKKVQEFQVPFENVRGWEKGKPLCGTEYRLYKIAGFGSEDGPYVELRDPAGKLPALKLYKGAEPLSMETDEWKAPEPVSEDPDGDDTAETEGSQDSGASSEDDDDGDDGGFFDD